MPDPTLPDIPVFDLRLEREDLDAVERSLRSGWLAMGPRTAELESVFAAHIGVSHAVAVSSCTAALHLAYLGAGVGPGDEVIVPSLSFAATATAVVYCGATPIFADIISIENPSLDPNDVAARITPRTRAVAVVHFCGYAAPVDTLADLCRDRGLALIEDVAHAPSASLDGRPLGSFGLAGAFSFFSNKVLPVGEGGMLVTDDARVATLARLRRSHAMTRAGWDKRQRRADSYDVSDLGFNYRFDDARSALCLSRLARLEKDVARRRELTMRYRTLLEPLDGLVLPFTTESVSSASGYVMPTFLRDPARRDPVRQRLRDVHGIQTTVFYPPIHEFTAYQKAFGSQSLSRTEVAGSTALMLPLFPHLTFEQQDRVVAALSAELSL